MLKPSNEKVTPKNIFGFDIETRGNKNKFVMGSILGKNFLKVFWNKKEMQNYFLYSHELRNSIIFATNLGFDFSALFDDVNFYKNFRIILRGSSFISVENRKNKNKWVMLDTLNFLKVSVSALGSILKVPKLDKPYFLGEDINLSYSEKQILEKYNIRDSEITYLFGEFLQSSFNELGTNLKYTVASTSMSLFRNKYLKCNFGQPSKEIIKEMFKGYYGGRTEAIYRGLIKDINYYDINSLYPYVMKKYKYPNPNTLIVLEKNNNIKYINGYEGLSYCKITTPKDLDIPLLPLRHEHKLMFPLGNFEGYYSHVELRKAMLLGYKVKPIKTFYYKETVNIFYDYVSDLYDKRLFYKKQKSPKELIMKLCLNSLYGKFSQRIQYSEIKTPEQIDINKFHEENIDRIENGFPIRYEIDCPVTETRQDKKGNLVIYPKLYYITDLDTEKYPKFINPIFSIYTTSYARLELYTLFEEIKSKNGNTYYYDTDSVFTNVKLETGKELGQLKLEIYANSGIIVKPKFYYVRNDFDNILSGLLGHKNLEFIKSKGLHNLKSFLEFDNILDTKKFKYTKFTKFKESLRRGLSFNEKIEVSKIINMEDNKRLWENEKFNKNVLEKSKPIKI